MSTVPAARHLRDDPAIHQMAAMFRRNPPPLAQVLNEDGTPRLSFMREAHHVYHGTSATDGITGQVDLVAAALLPLLFPTVTYQTQLQPDGQPECLITVTLDEDSWTVALREADGEPLRLVITCDGFPALDAAPRLFQALAAHRPGTVAEATAVLEQAGAHPKAPTHP